MQNNRWTSLLCICNERSWESIRNLTKRISVTIRSENINKVGGWIFLKPSRRYWGISVTRFLPYLIRWRHGTQHFPLNRTSAHLTFSTCVVHSSKLCWSHQAVLFSYYGLYKNLWRSSCQNPWEEEGTRSPRMLGQHLIKTKPNHDIMSLCPQRWHLKKS